MPLPRLKVHSDVHESLANSFFKDLRHLDVTLNPLMAAPYFVDFVDLDKQEDISYTCPRGRPWVARNASEKQSISATLPALEAVYIEELGFDKLPYRTYRNEWFIRAERIHSDGFKSITKLSTDKASSTLYCSSIRIFQRILQSGSSNGRSGLLLGPHGPIFHSRNIPRLYSPEEAERDGIFWPMSRFLFTLSNSPVQIGKTLLVIRLGDQLSLSGKDHRKGKVYRLLGAMETDETGPIIDFSDEDRDYVPGEVISSWTEYLRGMVYFMNING
ncbi:hypothetical protein C8J56DRAFT_1035378 [Mycena floridula]|nr:hypothetical protein C8J56DRAFT_1035378 [Mycena floridula]